MTQSQEQGAEGAEPMTGTLWCMHISGPDDVHAAPDFWTALSWAAELNAAVAARAIKQGWAGDDNWPLAQATVQRWPWSAERHADSLATELATRDERTAGVERKPIATAPLNEEVFVYCGEMRFRAKLVPGASMTMDEEPCDQWQATREGEHPPCWSDGCCWASNEDENASFQPTAWSPAPALTPGA